MKTTITSKNIFSKRELSAFDIEKKERRKKYIYAFFSRKITFLAVGLMAFFIFIAVFANFITPYDPTATDLRSVLQSPSLKHLFGTDQFGRDIFARACYGARVSLSVGVIAVLLAAFVGTMLGLLSGYIGGICDDIIMRACEVIRAIPQVVLASCFMMILKGSLLALIIVLSISSVPFFVRIIRAQVLLIRSQDYITARQVTGCSTLRIMTQHIFPNALPQLLVNITQSVSGAIMAEAGLSFLGLGVNNLTPTWGSMINSGQAYIWAQPVYALAPGILIILLALALNTLGDSLRDAMDPRLRGTM